VENKPDRSTLVICDEGDLGIDHLIEEILIAFRKYLIQFLVGRRLPESFSEGIKACPLASL
jgi:hypothetical protein